MSTTSEQENKWYKKHWEVIFTICEKENLWYKDNSLLCYLFSFSLMFFFYQSNAYTR